MHNYFFCDEEPRKILKHALEESPQEVQKAVKASLGDNYELCIMNSELISRSSVVEEKVVAAEAAECIDHIAVSDQLSSPACGKWNVQR